MRDRAESSKAGAGPRGGSPTVRRGGSKVSKEPRRRRFTADFKRRILEALERCEGRGDASALLRQEGLYWSHAAKWRRQREEGCLEDSWTEPAVRARIDLLVGERLELMREIEALEKQNAQLRDRLVLLVREPTE